MRSLRVLIAAILMVALCSVGSTAVADETDAPPDSTSTQTPETPDPEPTPDAPAPTEENTSSPQPEPAPAPTKSAPEPEAAPTADPTPKDRSAVVPFSPKSLKTSKKAAVALVADTFAVDDEFTMEMNSVSTLLDPSVTTNDTGIKPGSGFTHSGASHGLVVNPTGGFGAVYNYAPFADYFGDDTFTYTFTGTDDLEHTATVTIHITATPGAPQAVDDTYTVAHDSGATLLNPDVTANDIGIPAVTIVSATQAVNGTVTKSPGLGSHDFSYTPNAGYFGDDTFNYHFLDSTNVPHNATVTIHVTPPPGEAVDDEYTVAQDSGLTVLNPDVTANDTGIGPIPQFSHTPASRGFVSNAGPFGGGHDWAYSTSLGFFGDDTFEYTFIGNDGLEHTATVTIHVTQAAQHADDDEYTVGQDSGTTMLVPPVTLNDSVGTPLTFNNTAASHGVVTSTPFSSNYSYTPGAGFHGDDTFTYSFLGTDLVTYSATVTIHVVPPVVSAAVDDEYTVAQDSGATVLNPDVTANDTAVLGIFSNTPAGDGTVSVTALGHDYSYTPAIGFHGDDTFTYSFLGTDFVTRTGTVTIHVTATTCDSLAAQRLAVVAQFAALIAIAPPGNVPFLEASRDAALADLDAQIQEAGCNDPNDAPVAVDDSYTTSEDTTLTEASPGVLGNDTDSDANTLTAVKVTDPSHGTVTLNANGSLTYTPAAGFDGVDSFTYKTNDGTANSNAATVTITVTPTAPEPAAVDDEYTVAQGSGATLLDPDVYANDTGAIPNTFSHSGAPNGTATGGAGGGYDYSYTPAIGFHGDDTFTYSFMGTDFVTRTGTVTIHVTPTVVPSAAVDDEYTVTVDSGATLLSPDVTANDTGATGVFSHTQGANGTVTSTTDGHDFSYAPNAGFPGDDSFTYTFTGTDNVARTGTVTIHVTPTVVPSAAVDDEYTVAQDSGVTLLNPDVTNNDTGPAGTFSHTSAANGTVTSTSGGHDYSYEPNAGFFGDDSFTYTFTGTDNVSRTGTVTIHVTKTPLQAIDDTYAVTGDQPTVLDPPVTSNDLGLTPGVTTTIVGQPDHGTTTVDSSGNITYTPQDGYTGGDSFDYQLNPRIFTRSVAAAVAADLTGTVTLNVTDPGTAAGGSGGGDDTDDDSTDSTALLPDTGVGIGSRGLPLALLLLLAGSGVVLVSRRGRRHI